jgi:tetratricopeptide (TPR) repeat protein
MPLKPEIFHGRETLVQDIAQLLIKEESSRVCILGSGGMGKTSISLAVVESPLIIAQFAPEHLFWVPCIEATSATLLLDLLYTQLQITRNKQIRLSETISQLNASPQPRLILLDNFETPWNGAQKQVGDILRKLAFLKHVSILVTMRGSQAPCDKAITWQSRDLQPTAKEACMRIFHDINPDSENDPDVEALLTTLGHMPFAITLMANLGKQGQSTARELLNAWSKFGPDIFPGQDEQSMNRSISLSVYGSFVKQNQNANLLLKVLSLLPAGTTKDNLSWWAPTLEVSMIPSAIVSLSAAALLVKKPQQSTASPVLFVLPVVQSFMQQHNRIEEDLRAQTFSSCCQYVLDNACRYDDPRFRVNAKDLAAEDTNIQSVLFSRSPSSELSEKTIEAFIALSWHYCDTTPNPEIASRTVEAAKAFGVENYIASAVWCLGRTYYNLDNKHHLAYANLQQAYQLFNALPPDSLTQRLGGQCGIDFVNCARHVDEQSKIVSLARDVEPRCATLSDNLVHARSLVFLGVVLDTAEQWAEALHSLSQAETLLKVLKNDANLAYAYQITARVHYHQHQLQDALAAVEDAWKYAELSDSPYIQAFVSQEHARILFSADRDREAWACLEVSLMMAAQVGNRGEVAKALEYMGYGYLRRGDYENAYGAYEAAAVEYCKSGEAWVEETCGDNLARIKRKQEENEVVIGFRRPHLSVEKSLFYGPVQVSVGHVPVNRS